MTRSVKVALRAGSTEGERLIARFCDAVDGGQQPAAGDLQVIAKALAVFLEAGNTEEKAAKVAKRLKVTRKQGRQPGMTHARAERYGRCVLELEDLTREMGASAARQAILAKYHIEPKTLRDRVKNYQGAVAHLRKMDAIFSQFVQCWGPVFEAEEKGD